MTFYLYLKSHTEAPDFEDYCEAETKDEAVNMFYSQLGKYGWDKTTISENTLSEL